MDGLDKNEMTLSGVKYITDGLGTNINNGKVLCDSFTSNNDINCKQLYINGALIVPSQSIGQPCTVQAGTASLLTSGSNPTVLNSGHF